MSSTHCLKILSENWPFIKTAFAGKRFIATVIIQRKVISSNISSRTLDLTKLVASYYVPNTQNLFYESEPEHGGYIECTLDDVDANIADLPCKSFNDNGDFRSQECISLLKQADIVVTNPPFSIFREHLAQITRYKKDFLVIGNINAISRSLSSNPNK